MDPLMQQTLFLAGGLNLAPAVPGAQQPRRNRGRTGQRDKPRRERKLYKTYRFREDLNDALIKMLERPDWHLHLPFFQNFPWYTHPEAPVGIKKPEHGFLASSMLQKKPWSLAFDDDDEEAHSLEPWDNPQPNLFILEDNHNIVMDGLKHRPNYEQNSKLLSRYSTEYRTTSISWTHFPIATPATLVKYILSPFNIALRRVDGGVPFLPDFRKKWSPPAQDDKYDAFERAAEKIIRHLVLDPKGHLQWRPLFFEYSLSTVKLTGAKLDSKCLGAIADFLRGNTQVQELDLTNNRVLDDAVTTKRFADAISQSHLVRLALASNESAAADTNVEALLMNLRSDTLREINLSGVFIKEYGRKLLQSRGTAITDAVEKELCEQGIRVAMCIGAFIHRCGRGKLYRFLMTEPAFEEAEYARQKAAGVRRPRLLRLMGCPAMHIFHFNGMDISAVGMKLINEGRHKLIRFKDGVNRRMRMICEPRTFQISTWGSFTSCHRQITEADYTRFYELASYDGNLSAPELAHFKEMERRFTKTPPREGAYITLSGSGDADINTMFEQVLYTKVGASLRNAAWSLVTASRVLGCRVRPGRQKSPRFNRCHWLQLPAEVRRSILSFIPALYSISEADGVRLLPHPRDPSEEALASWREDRRCVLSNSLISRIMSFGTDARTIGYGKAPEDVLLPLRLASDDIACTPEAESGPRHEPRLFGEPVWRFSTAAYRWRPTDVRSDWGASSLCNNKTHYPWEAEAFLRAVDLPGDVYDLPPGTW